MADSRITIQTIAACVLAVAVVVAGAVYVVRLDIRTADLSKTASERDEKLNKLEEDVKRVFDPLPPGTVIASILQPSVFLANAGDKWRLADKSRIPEGRLLEMLRDPDTKIDDESRLPDLRGMFLRGQNEGREDDKQDPDDRLPGSFQGAATKLPSKPFEGVMLQSGQHEHNYYRARAYKSGAGDHVRAKRDGPLSLTQGSGLHDHEVKIESGGDKETRPVNVSVFFYIKVD